MKKDYRKAPLKRIATKADLAVVLVLGFVSCVIPLLVYIFGEILHKFTFPDWFGSIKYLVYLSLGMITFMLFYLIWSICFNREVYATTDYSLTKLLDSSLGRVVDSLDMPIIACDDKDVLFWNNNLAQNIDLGKGIDKNKLGMIIPFTSNHKKLVVGDRIYECSPIETTSENNKYYFYTLHDITNYVELKNAYHDEHVAVGYICIDAMDELVQFDPDGYRRAKSQLDLIIKDWSIELSGLLQPYDNDKYFVVFSTISLEKCLESKFDILEKVRSVSVGDGISMTISLGISNIKGSLQDAEKNASAALELAMQRGGDQVVYRNDDDIEFFGGITKGNYKRSNSKSRVFAWRLKQLIDASSNVLIMGHQFADFDAFGSCVGIARFCFEQNKEFSIVSNLDDDNLQVSFDIASKVAHLKDSFIDKNKANKLLTPNTLVVLVDANNFEVAENTDLLKHASKIGIIDHHIKKEQLPSTVVLSYIDTTASSACELVTEMLEYGAFVSDISPDEADLILSGILLDTKQFTKNAGTRTFSTAQFLRGKGANLTTTVDLFKSSMEDVVKEAKFFTNMFLYGDKIAISYAVLDEDSSSRVIASKVADKMLSIKDIEASFSIVQMEDVISISARSNGRINVQLIMEVLGGGGHFDMAGAQLTEKTLEETIKLLKNAVDDYFAKNK